MLSLQCARDITTIIEDKGSNYDVIYDNRKLSDVFSKFLNYDHSIVANDLAYSFLSPSGQSVKVPKYKSIFRNNTVFRNYGGFGEGLIDIKGFIRFYLINNTFIGNGENTLEITNYLKSLLNEDFVQ